MSAESSGRLRPQQPQSAPLTDAFLPIRILEWDPKPWRKLRGYVTVLAGDLKLIDCPVYMVNGTLRASLPARPVYDQRGKHLVSPNTGRLQYEVVIECRSRAVADKFSEAVVSTLLAAHPEVEA